MSWDKCNLIFCFAFPREGSENLPKKLQRGNPGHCRKLPAIILEGRPLLVLPVIDSRFLAVYNHQSHYLCYVMGRLLLGGNLLFDHTVEKVYNLISHFFPPLLWGALITTSDYQNPKKEKRTL